MTFYFRRIWTDFKRKMRNLKGVEICIVPLAFEHVGWYDVFDTRENVKVVNRAVVEHYPQIPRPASVSVEQQYAPLNVRVQEE
ncbi:hypothetical protein RvY_10423 [Ramazzottius varieornatus]|uniref:Uncharacterized protein n=1 Tax=Ramazzottius varieornatus TaxID=947166 RepID=A0A1D1VCP7_RAMVA|nr:hypothetical protein RvY_10423 [Ramazzottius varieornatus]